MNILAFEVANFSCSAAVLEGDQVLSLSKEVLIHGQGARLVPLLQAILRESRVNPNQLDLVVCTTGPGSFTGIRVGLSVAKAFEVGLKIPVMGMTSFEWISRSCEEKGTRLIQLEAHRKDFYCALYDGDHRPLKDPESLLPEDIHAYAEGAMRLTSEAILSCDAASLGRAAFDLFQKGHLDSYPLKPFYLRAPDVKAS